MSVRASGFYVYAYIDPRTNEPFYIGKGSGGRAWVHISLAHGLRTESSFYHHLDQMLDDDIFPKVELVKQRLSDAEAFRSEQALILLTGTQSLGTGPLLNKGPGIPIRAWGKTFPSLAAVSRDYRCVISYPVLQRLVGEGKPVEKAASGKLCFEDVLGTQVTCWGEEFRSLRAVSRDARCVISYSRLYHYISAGKPLEEAAAGEFPSKNTLGTRVVCWGEEFHSLAALLRDVRCRVPRYHLAARLRASWPAEDAVRIPVRVKL